MDIKEIVKSITELENQLKEKDQLIKTLQKEIGVLKSENQEVEERLKTTLTAILRTVKQGLSNPNKVEDEVENKSKNK